jgi:CubicO group peptidase (beta-lactamase class C family)
LFLSALEIDDALSMSQARNPLLQLILAVAIASPSICCGGLAEARETIWPMPQWQTSTPEAEGVDSSALAKLVAYGKARSFDSLLIARHGRIVLDAYYAPYTAEIPHIANSVTKAVTGTLIAIALKEGLLDSLDHPALEFFNERKIANVDDRKRAMTVQHLLNMTSGFEWDEGFEGGRAQSLTDMGRSADWVQFVLDRPMAHTPGDLFYYNTGNAYLLSAIIQKLSGRSAGDYANAKLFAPLGIAPPFWRRAPLGLTMGGCCLMLLPRDMARIGYLYLHGGEWAGQQLLPPSYVGAVNHATVDMHSSFDPSLRYSQLFWAFADKHVVMAEGDHCHLIMLFPDLDIVAVTTARDYCSFRQLADQVAGAVQSDSTLPPNPEAADRLTRELNEVAKEKPIAVGPIPASAVSGVTLAFPDNALNLKALSLTLAGPDPGYRLDVYTQDATNSSIRLDGPIGLDGFYRKGTPDEFGVRAARGSWLDQRTFAVDFNYVGLDEQHSWQLTFGGDRVTLHAKTRDGREIAVEGKRGE